MTSRKRRLQLREKRHAAEQRDVRRRAFYRQLRYSPWLRLWRRFLAENPDIAAKCLPSS